MAGLKEIKIRMKSVTNTKKITYAMKLVSATKMRGAIEAVEKSKNYSTALNDLLAGVLASLDKSQISHPLLLTRPEKKIKVIIIGANRGLCGGYNTNINKTVKKFYAEKLAENPTLEIKSQILGKKPAEYFKNEKLVADDVMVDLSENPASWPLEQLCQDAEIEFIKGEIDACYLVYTSFQSALSMTAKTTKLFPVSADDLAEQAEGGDASSLTKFEPSTEEVFEELLPRIVRTKLRQSALDAKASEHASRMTAMDNATKNAGDLIKKLTKKFNRLRQAGITSDILDIVNGANAVD